MLIDDFHSPLKPEEYFNLRVKGALKFYRGRLPQYTRTSFWTQVFFTRSPVRVTFILNSGYFFVLQILLAVGAAAGTLFGLFHLACWSTVLIAFTTMVTGWSEFSGFTDKQHRCNTS